MWTLDKALDDEDVIVHFRRPPEVDADDFIKRLIEGIRAIGITCEIDVDPEVDELICGPVDSSSHPDPTLN